MGCGIGWGWHLAWDLSPVRAHSLWAGLCAEKLVKKNTIHNIACVPPTPPPSKFSEVELLGTASTLTKKEENLP